MRALAVRLEWRARSQQQRRPKLALKTTVAAELFNLDPQIAQNASALPLADFGTALHDDPIELLFGLRAELKARALRIIVDGREIDAILIQASTSICQQTIVRASPHEATVLLRVARWNAPFIVPDRESICLQPHLPPHGIARLEAERPCKRAAK